MENGSNSQRQKLLVILGAGSSIPYGMPCVSALNKQMIKWSDEWEHENQVNPFKSLWNVSQGYYKQDKFHKGVYPNYESVLGNMLAIAKWLSLETYGDPIIDKLIEVEDIGKLFGFVDGGCLNAGTNNLDQHQFLIDILAKYFRAKCQEVENTPPENFDGYINFFKEIRKAFDVGVYNLNHDNLAYRALKKTNEGVFTGFDDWNFQPDEIYNRKEWDFLYHLHGSVHFNLIENLDLTHETDLIIWQDWQDDGKKSFTDIGFPQMEASFDANWIPLATILTGGFKREQLAPEPFQTFQSALSKHVHEADAILIIGYGFGDSHINRALQNRFYLPSRHKPPPKVYIIDKEAKEENFFWNTFTKQVFILSGVVDENDKDFANYLERSQRVKFKLDKRGTEEAFADTKPILDWLKGKV